MFRRKGNGAVVYHVLVACSCVILYDIRLQAVVMNASIYLREITRPPGDREELPRRVRHHTFTSEHKSNRKFFIRD